MSDYAPDWLKWSKSVYKVYTKFYLNIKAKKAEKSHFSLCG